MNFQQDFEETTDEINGILISSLPGYKVPNTDFNKIIILDKQRDDIVEETEDEYNLQTHFLVVKKQINEFIDYFKGIFKLSNETTKQNKDAIGKLEKDVQETQIKIDQINSTEPFIKTLLVVLLAVYALYLFSSILGSIVHILALIILIGGLYYAMNNNGKSTFFTNTSS
jgi:hypothetical protein